MAHKQLYLNSLCGNKGAIFTLDSIIALFIVFTLLGASFFFIEKSQESPLSNLQASRIVSDIFAILDYKGILRDLDITQIKSELNSIIPRGYTVEFKVNCNNRVYDSRTLSTLSQQPIFSGERVFVDNNFNNCIARYWIWEK